MPLIRAAPAASAGAAPAAPPAKAPAVSGLRRLLKRVKSDNEANAPPAKAPKPMRQEHELAAGQSWLDALTEKKKGPLKTLKAESLINGTVLRDIARDLVAATNNPTLRKERTHTIGTMCSGSEVLTLVTEALEAELQAAGYPQSFEPLFTCEIDKNKREWGMDMINRGSCCCFGNICEMDQKEAWCYKHEKKCVIPRVEGAVAGTSCKDFAKCNNNRGKQGHVMKKGSSAGGSSDTFYGFVGYLDVHAPDWVILENSDALLDGDRVNFDLMCSEVSSRGYDIKPLILEAMEFAVPTARRRLYLMGVLNLAKSMVIKDANRHWGEVRQLVCRAQRKPPELQDVLLTDDDEAVEDLLQLRKEKTAAKLQKDTNSMLLDASTDKKHMQVFQESHLRWGGEKCRPRSIKSPWMATMGEREREVLMFFQAQHADEYAASKGVLVVDVGQSIERVRSASAEAEVSVLPTILPNSKIWMSLGAKATRPQRMKVERLLLGTEALRLQGLNVEHLRPDLLKKDSNNLMMSLAGNMFSGTVILTTLSALILSTEWKTDDEPTETDGDDVDTALAVLRSLKGQSA